ncbi:MAG TPA: 2-oxoglutarate dehydrogenase complex dihydrolipoyllysine-residue succinyltransferase [Chthonomonas sp.]|jgi:2-oxoglutarate dehydrogenase E2 component (dihydrolipoamide succinyltransferase)|uniref:2-oxoglutarate dehydrogenase complex dihydrolipoyllysine-residue succinyltransferase n=1 Tax=Chthonomonas sp. TaxID=2282153 RepID=UPI002B4B5607|nr:2-oxoglutarate dehydrogenase complex dihydrolipoyllysine-residue succinyltransferase [Chthonomonas sp.]HLH80770.1 2-oxoglutarate dehydrogenase complex dihydrolipoyllysine-residue succinyltransferase [Chthonomonas sp.]
MGVEIQVPQLAESVVEATVGTWYKKEGDRVERDEEVVELATDKVSLPVYAPATGILQKIVHPEGDTVKPGDVLAIVVEAEAAAVPAAPQAVKSAVENAPVETAVAEKSEAHPPIATPLAEKVAVEQGIDLSALKGKGSGPNGKITIEDVRQFTQASSSAPPSVEKEPQKPTASTPSGTLPPVLSSLTASFGRREEREPLSRLRLTLIRNLQESERNAVRLTTFNEADMSAVIEIRKRRRDAFKERYGVNLGFMSFFTKAVVGALKAFPYLNAEIQGTEVIKKYYYDIGIAVGSERGLTVPVIRDADRKTFAELEAEIADLAARAREGRLKLEELMGGTFTITNGGVYGSLLSTPILNGNQVGILGMHKIQERPVVVNGEIVIRPMMYLALSYDHRLIDGSDAVRFLVRIKELIEDPETLLLEG